MKIHLLYETYTKTVVLDLTSTNFDKKLAGKNARHEDDGDFRNLIH